MANAFSSPAVLAIRVLTFPATGFLMKVMIAFFSIVNCFLIA